MTLITEEVTGIRRRILRESMADTKKKLVERLFAEHGVALQAFLARRVRRQPIAAELAQEVYVRMLRVPDLGTVRNPEAYLYTVASNLVKEQVRGERKTGIALDVDDVLVQAQLSELPAFGGEMDVEQRVRRSHCTTFRTSSGPPALGSSGPAIGTAFGATDSTPGVPGVL